MHRAAAVAQTSASERLEEPALRYFLSSPAMMFNESQSEAPKGNRCAFLRTASSTITWQFVPPHPNELTPPVAGFDGSGQGSSFVTTRRFVFSKSMCRLGLSKFRLG